MMTRVYSHTWRAGRDKTTHALIIEPTEVITDLARAGLHDQVILDHLRGDGTRLVLACNHKRVVAYDEGEHLDYRYAPNPRCQTSQCGHLFNDPEGINHA